MARERRSEVVITGAWATMVAPGASIAPERWAGKEARLARMDRLCALALVACDGALRDGAFNPTAPEWDGERTGIVFGSAFGCHATNEDYYRGVVRDGALGASPRLFAYTLPSSPLGEVSIHYGVRGPTTALCTGLTSGLDALAEAVALVGRGRARRALACAAEVATPLLARIVAGAGPSRHDGPTPLDAAAAMLIERVDDAAARGATPRARLLASDAVFIAEARTQAVGEVVRRVLSRADVAVGGPARLLAPAADAAATQRIGVRADADVAAAQELSRALGAAPLIAVARVLMRDANARHDASSDELVLACAGDDSGAATAALLQLL